MIKLPNEIMGRAISDAEFRKSLFADPEGTLKAANVSVDAATLAALKNLDPKAVDAYLGNAGAAVGDAAAM